MYFYQLFGFTIASEIECPELPQSPNVSAPDVHFKRDQLSEDIADRVKVYPRSFLRPQIGSGVFQFELPGIARYRVEAGSTIRVSPFQGSTETDIRPYLLGTAMGALLLQRRLLPLHVCAIAFDGQAHAFCGQSGAGKSTLALAFLRQGVRLLCDDVGLAVPQNDGQVRFYPGFPRVKLWRDTLGHFNIDEAPLARDVSRANKFHMNIEASFSTRPLPLAGLYALEKGPPDAPPRFEALDRHRAIGLLIEHTYRTELVMDVGDPHIHLRQCAEVARSVPAFSCYRPWDLDEADRSACAILEQLRQRKQPIGVA